MLDVVQDYYISNEDQFHKTTQILFNRVNSFRSEGHQQTYLVNLIIDKKC